MKIEEQLIYALPDKGVYNAVSVLAVEHPITGELLFIKNTEKEKVTKTDLEYVDRLHREDESKKFLHKKIILDPKVFGLRGEEIFHNSVTPDVN